MENTKQLSIVLKDIQSQVIGLFRPRYYPADQYIPVIEDKDGILTCIEIGTLLGLQILHIGAESGRYVKFPIAYPDSKPGVGLGNPHQQTLTDMMKDPILFSNWYKENVYHSK